VEVLNGSGKKGAAKEFARRLEENGYKVVRVANASGAATDHPSSEVLFRTTNASTAREIADMVGGATVVPDAAGLGSESAQPRRRSELTGYTVILGQDYQTEEQL
jgi:Zn-dependent membrane protease YugP